ncbi:MAG: bifunctional phosphoribosylaminoimidazolecarboxamide formyltransferase/IMP cyclohydrolase [Puniceicoccaceae bacterium]|nr:bifunctional phosphoribosylaminoimidazolecarboxamide formyltransferase/IMP cyclohydrolase [Puniceicoccaceae bacterium]
MQKTALLSVSDKSGLVPFARALVERHGYRLLSTGGTAKLLEKEQIAVMEVSEYTGFPEMMQGRLKTLHPKIHGGLLARRDKSDHMIDAAAHCIDMIDLVVVNLYPFESTVAKPDVSFNTAIENIDIGGPSMLRSAAKNHESVTVIVDSADYDKVLEALDQPSSLSKLRRELAMKVFKRTAYYDNAIANYLETKVIEEPDLGAISGIPLDLSIELTQAQALRYGENPHQHAALYGNFFDCFEQHQGKDLSFNNIIDITAATYLIGEFQRPTVAILKHTNPCGVASADNLVTAWEEAYQTDKQAPFGGIIIVNQTMDADLASIVSKIFCEVIIAPEFTPAAREVFSKKKNLRLMTAKGSLPKESMREVRSVIGGLLLQDRDGMPDRPSNWKVVTARQPTAEEMRAMIFGWSVVKHVKSNAIVYAGCECTLGIGAGQMSRVDSSKIAVWKAGKANISLTDSVVCSDAFFPFPDGLIAAADAGAVAAIQPGGSVRDDAVIQAANERNMAMVFTAKRHFKH